MNKVNIEITSEGWRTTVTLNGEEYVEEHKRTSSGAKQVSEFAFEDYDEITDNLYDALNSFFEFDVMRALQKYDNY